MSLRAVFEAIISPEGWGGRLWDVLDRWGLVNLTRDQVADDLLAAAAQETALVRYAMKDRPHRLRILDGLDLPHDLDTGEAERARMLAGFSPTAYDPKPDPAPTVDTPSPQDVPTVSPERDQPKPEKQRRNDAPSM